MSTETCSIGKGPSAFTLSELDRLYDGKTAKVRNGRKVSELPTLDTSVEKMDKPLVTKGAAGGIFRLRNTLTQMWSALCAG